MEHSLVKNGDDACRQIGYAIAMLAVLFEVRPKPEGYEPYLAIAAALRPVLDTMPGLRSIDRFRNLRDPAVILSHQWWDDEAALAQWRNVAEHQKAQRAGRDRLFADYRLRIGEEVEGAGAHPDAPHVAIVASTGAACVGATDAFESIYTPGRFLSLFDGLRFDEARTSAESAAVPQGAIESRRVCRIVRDYGMFARDQAPADLRARHDSPAHG